MARENKINTRLEIIQVATRLFLERGYTNVLVSDIVGEIGISKGNLTFYFPTKEHLLAELIHRLCDFQWELMGKTAAEKNPLTAYLLEITAMTASYCENPVARELYVSAYTSQLSLEIIRENDTRKAKRSLRNIVLTGRAGILSLRRISPPGLSIPCLRGGRSPAARLTGESPPA